ncbi:hypothetical protein ACFOD9_08645 [Novosphingobium bradum]|uniref:Uncharacterized protein n=1 Tax=Novosphingobium bradum TaxID=1737444 RepID=A0ABV7INP3_9SPHN
MPRFRAQPHLLAPLAAALLAAPQLAAAAEPVCLTPREFTALSTYALPSVIGGTARACTAQLPENAFLRRNGDELASRYAQGKGRAWPEARAAFLKMSGSKDPAAAQMFTAMPDDALQQVADAALTGIVAGQVKPGSCAAIDRVVALLSPLPAENTAELIALAAGLGARTGEARLGRFALCKA